MTLNVLLDTKSKVDIPKKAITQTINTICSLTSPRSYYLHYNTKSTSFDLLNCDKVKHIMQIIIKL